MNAPSNTPEDPAKLAFRRELEAVLNRKVKPTVRLAMRGRFLRKFAKDPDKARRELSLLRDS